MILGYKQQVISDMLFYENQFKDLMNYTGFTYEIKKDKCLKKLGQLYYIINRIYNGKL